MTLPEVIAERDRHEARVRDLKAQLYDEQQAILHLDAQIEAEARHHAATQGGN